MCFACDFFEMTNMNHIYHLPEHQTLRDQMARFLEREVEPYGLEWEKTGKVPREVLRKMGEAGFFGLMYDSEYGGADHHAKAKPRVRQHNVSALRQKWGCAWFSQERPPHVL